MGKERMVGITTRVVGTTWSNKAPSQRSGDAPPNALTCTLLLSATSFLLSPRQTRKLEFHVPSKPQGLAGLRQRGGSVAGATAARPVLKMASSIIGKDLPSRMMGPLHTAAAMDPPFNRDIHLRYQQRCLRSFLPRPYTANDSTRMLLGCFAVAAIDLLSPPSSDPTKPIITLADRRLFREWILACQHPGGGFCGSPTHALPAHEYEGYDFDTQRAEPGTPGAANIAATYFALQLLAVLAEGDGAAATSAFAGVDRVATLSWLRRLQREDGSFGEVLVEIPSKGGKKKTWLVAGGRDMRYCYLAAMIRWVLRGDVKPGERGWVEDIDVEALATHIRNGQTYDGGFAESSTHESHGGCPMRPLCIGPC